MNSFSQLVLIMAAFAALFLGTEFSQRAVVNKVAVGHSKVSVYFSSLLTCTVGSLIINFAYAAGVAVMGFLSGGQARIIDDDLGKLVIAAAADIALSAVLTLICMLIGNKALCTAAALIVFFVTPFIAESVNIAVQQPPYFERRVYNEDKTSYTSEITENGEYVSGAGRIFLTALNNVSPLGQYRQLESGDVHDDGQLASYPLYSLVLTAAVSAAGAAVFRKKDLK